MKKFISFVLVLAALMTLAAVPASAASSKTTIQQALVETAFAYYYKELCVQYDSNPLTYQSKAGSGAARISSGSSPEMAAWDNTVYTVCSDYCSDVYYDVFGEWLMGGPRKCVTENLVEIPATAPEVVVKFGGDGMTDREAAIKKARESLQPGDMVVYHSGSGGHAMLFAGDVLGDGKEYLIHSGGSKLDVETGVDRKENLGPDSRGNVRGSIRLNEVDAYCFTKDSSYGGNLYKTSKVKFCILRMWQADYMPKTVTAKALSRIKWSGIEIDRSADRAIHQSVLPGEEMTVTLTVKNNGTKDYKSLPVSEPVPVGAVIVENSANEGGTAKTAGVSWRVDVPAGSEKKLSYKVKITAQPGDTVVLPAGQVDAIPSRELSFRVGVSRVAEDAFREIIRTGTVPGMALPTGTQTAFANEFYKATLGIDPGLPETMQEFVDGLFVIREDAVKVTLTNGRMFSRKTELTPEMTRISNMILPRHVLGRAFLFETDVPHNYGAWDRVLDLEADYYEPGDIFVGMRGRNVLKVENPDMVFVYIYLGDGMVLTRNRYGKPLVTSFEATADKLMRMNLAFVLRPGLV